jgi:tRNA-specific 2-thiouridylase
LARLFIIEDRIDGMTESNGKKVIVAMSGGVDSSVAAALLLEQGYEVVGLMLRLWAEPGGAANRCCTPDSMADARQVADALGIPFYVRDYKEIFKSTVVDFFIDEYARGGTPNPCIICNRDIRFDRLLQEALALGGDYLATGHYARVHQSASGRYQLLKGLDPAKDQSYMLYTMTQERLAHVLLPVGQYHKPRIREIAHQKNLPVFDRPDSQDLSFLAPAIIAAFWPATPRRWSNPVPSSPPRGGCWGSITGWPFTPSASGGGWGSRPRNRCTW